jgi:hypothetical protein
MPTFCFSLPSEPSLDPDLKFTFVGGFSMLPTHCGRWRHILSGEPTLWGARPPDYAIVGR